MGFMHTTRDIPTIMQTLRDAGYLTGILGKVDHSTPKVSYQWDFVHDQNELGNGRDPEIYYRDCREFLARCRRRENRFTSWSTPTIRTGRIHIPGKPIAGAKEPSKTYTPAEVPVPGFVPDLPGVRRN